MMTNEPAQKFGLVAEAQCGIVNADEQYRPYDRFIKTVVGSDIPLQPAITCILLMSIPWLPSIDFRLHNDHPIIPIWIEILFRTKLWHATQAIKSRVVTTQRYGDFEIWCKGHKVHAAFNITSTSSLRAHF